MKKKLVLFALTAVMTLGSTFTVFAELDPNAKCTLYPNRTHFYINSVSGSDCDVTIYKTDGTKLNFPTDDVSNYEGTVAAGQWYCAGSEKSILCSGTHGSKPKPAPTPAPCQPAKKQGKTDEQRAEEKKQAEAMYAGIRDFYEFHPVEWNYVGSLFAINPALGLQAEYQCVADATLEEYNKQMEAFFAQYAEQMALYEAMMNAQNAQ